MYAYITEATKQCIHIFNKSNCQPMTKENTSLKHFSQLYYIKSVIIQHRNAETQGETRCHPFCPTLRFCVH